MTSTPITQSIGLTHGPGWTIMFDEDGESKTWVNIGSPSHQAIKLLNGTPLTPGSELRGREIRRTPPCKDIAQRTPFSSTPHGTMSLLNRLHTSSVKVAWTSHYRSCSRQPCKACLPRPNTYVSFERSAKLTPQGNQSTPAATKCEQRKLVFCEEDELSDDNDSVRFLHWPSKNSPRI